MLSEKRNRLSYAINRLYTTFSPGMIPAEKKRLPDIICLSKAVGENGLNRDWPKLFRVTNRRAKEVWRLKEEVFMKKNRKGPKGKSQSSYLQHSKLIEAALSQPGVREVMAVYNHWRTLEDVAQHQSKALGVKRVISASNSSGPIVRRIT
jgi:hypothetical protein